MFDNINVSTLFSVEFIGWCSQSILKMLIDFISDPGESGGNSL